MLKCQLGLVLGLLFLFSGCDIGESQGCQNFLRRHGQPGSNNSFLFEGVRFYNDICASEYRQLKSDLAEILKPGEVPKSIVMIDEALVVVYPRSVLEGSQYVLEKSNGSWQVTQNPTLKERYRRSFSYDYVAVLRESYSGNDWVGHYAGMRLTNLSPIKLYWYHGGKIDYLRPSGWGWKDLKLRSDPSLHHWAHFYRSKPLTFECPLRTEADSFRVSIFLSESKDAPRTIEDMYWFTFATFAERETLRFHDQSWHDWEEVYEQRPN